MRIQIQYLTNKVLATLREHFNEHEAQQIAEHVIWAELSGIKTCGLVKMTGAEPIQKIKPKHSIEIERDTKLSQVLNAGACPSPLASQMATDVVLSKAKEHGFGVVGVHNTFSSNGALAFYVERIARNDLIGIAMARSPGAMAPFNSIDPLFGTNPMAFSFPTKEDPVVFDMATSAIPFYGLVLAKARGQSIPAGVAIDSKGELTTDPAAAMNGAILPFDRSYKGSSLGMIVEIMAGPLLGSAYCDCETFDKEWGSIFLAIDPGLLVDTQAFKHNCSALIRKVRSSRTRDTGEVVRLPGDRARAVYTQAMATGMVEVDDSVMRELGYVE